MTILSRPFVLGASSLSARDLLYRLITASNTTAALRVHGPLRNGDPTIHPGLALYGDSEFVAIVQGIANDILSVACPFKRIEMEMGALDLMRETTPAEHRLSTVRMNVARFVAWETARRNIGETLTLDEGETEPVRSEADVKELAREMMSLVSSLKREDSPTLRQAVDFALPDYDDDDFDDEEPTQPGVPPVTGTYGNGKPRYTGPSLNAYIN